MKKILFIDDDEIVLETFRLVFTDLNYKVVTCANGKDGIEVAKRESFDLIIVDYQMPEINGIEVVMKIREQGINDKIYILTSHINESDLVSDAKKAGVDGIMEKPFELSKIITLMGYA